MIYFGPVSSSNSSQEWDFSEPAKRMALIPYRGATDITLFSLARAGAGLPVHCQYPDDFKKLRWPGFRIATFTDISEQVRARRRTPHRQRGSSRIAQMEIEEDLRLAARVQNSLAPRSLVWGTMSVDAFLSSRGISIGGDFALGKFAGTKTTSACSSVMFSGHGIGFRAGSEPHLLRNDCATCVVVMPFPRDVSESLKPLPYWKDIAASGMFCSTLAAARIDAQRRKHGLCRGPAIPRLCSRVKGQGPLVCSSLAA